LFITERGLKNSSARIFPKNTVLIAMYGATAGQVGILKFEAATNQAICGILPSKNYIPEFLYYFFICNKDFLIKQAVGGAQPNISQVKIKKNALPIIPITEQRRIVGILDDVFEGIKFAKENTEKSLRNSKELFESYLQGVFTPPSLKLRPDKKSSARDWEEKKLGFLFQTKPPKREAHEKLNNDDLVSFVPMEDMKIGTKEFICDKERKLMEVNGSYTYFANEDVLLAKITPCFENGKLGIARNLKNGIGFGSSEYIVFRSNGEVIPDYLYYFLVRNVFRMEGAKRMSGAVGHKRVSKEFIEESILPFPKSIKEQKAIVARLDALSAETKKLEGIYRQKLADLEELKKSVLRKAFSGEL
jgi:type I restriction enzyme S subunit